MNTYNVKSLSAALTALKPLLQSNKKNSIPVMGFVHVTGDMMTATDLETGVSVKIDGQGQDEFLLNHEIMTRFVTPQELVGGHTFTKTGKMKKVTSAPIETEYLTVEREDRASCLRQTDEWLKLTAGEFECRLASFVTTEFPNVVPASDSIERVTLPAGFLAAVKAWSLRRVYDQDRTAFHYVQVSADGATVRASMTNANEAVELSVPSTVAPFSVNVPLSIITLASKLVDGATLFTKAHDLRHETMVMLQGDAATITGRDTSGAVKEFDELYLAWELPALRRLTLDQKAFKHDSRQFLLTASKYLHNLELAIDGDALTVDWSRKNRLAITGQAMLSLAEFSAVDVLRYEMSSYLRGECVLENGIRVKYCCNLYRDARFDLTAPAAQPIVAQQAHTIAPGVEPTQEQEPVKEAVKVNVFEEMKKKKVELRKQEREVKVKGFSLSDNASLLLDALFTRQEDVVFGMPFYPIKCERHDSRMVLGEVEGLGNVTHSWEFVKAGDSWSPVSFTLKKKVVTPQTMPHDKFLRMAEEWVDISISR